MAERWLKIIISSGAIGVAVLHLARPELQIDVITFGLIVVAILPWLNKLIKKAEFPGGWKVEFHDVEAAGEKITRSEINQARPVEAPSPSYVEISDRDPNLALVGLRIEIERRLRKLARQTGLTEDRPLTYMIGDLRRLGVLNEASFSGLPLRLRNAGPLLSNWRFKFLRSLYAWKWRNTMKPRAAGALPQKDMRTITPGRTRRASA